MASNPGTVFGVPRGAIERHEGTVEKFAGDGVMAVFGIPQAHEDDALRAVRAAAEIGSALAQEDFGVPLAVRTGVNTGEVVAGGGDASVIGDPVNVAARLEQAAGSGEILLGGLTHRLVRDAVRAEAVEPLELKGKSKPVMAWRLVGVLPGAPALARRFETPLLGRGWEVDILRQAFERVVEAVARACVRRLRLRAVRSG